MKIEASDCESAAAPSQQQQLTSATTTSLNNNENDTNNSSAAGAATAATTPRSTKITEMTDERNNSTNNKNNNNKNNNNDRIVEAAKILLKNGINGANSSVAATLLSAAATAAVAADKEINLPPPQTPLPSSIHANSVLHSAQTTTAAQIGCSINNGLSSATLRATSTNQQQFSTAETSTKAMAAATATSTANEFLSTVEHLVATTPPTTALGAGGTSAGVKVDNGGVIDYTISANSAPIALITASSNKKKIPSNNDIGRHPISSATNAGGGSRQNFGGRLQFFKDGKFILELARSKDGEKGGWVSVPRKLFRAPASATSSTITPTSTSSTTYPKNESSTSLSFSDDNSSIQSSPWQRDHCWKQSAPRYGISKELSHYYQRSNRLKLTTIGLQALRKKRRRPFDSSITPSFVATFTPLKQEGAKNASHAGEHLSFTKAATKSRRQRNCGNNSEDDASSSSSTSTLTGADCVDGANSTTTPTPTLLSAELSTDDSTKKDTEMFKCDARNSAEDSDNIGNNDGERMNTSEDDQDVDVSMAVSTLAAVGESSSKDKLNGGLQADNAAILDFTPPSQPPKTIKVATSKETNAETGAGEKRLKQLNTRAKLITIIQKLIDRVPTAGLLFTSKTPQCIMSGNGGTATFNQSNSMAHKISPPSSSSSATTSRLVELQHHQQHVSPRKRILREFEKVSLEDTGPTAVGGKRSRAKGNATASNAAKSSPQRVQSTGCAVLTSTSTTTATTATNGSFNKTATKAAPSTVAPVSSTPTRLYSSYSIHSLLGGGYSSSSNATATSTASSKRISEQAVNSNMNYQQLQHQQQQQQKQHHLTDPSYLRAMLASPKSPENNIGSALCGGKSPSSNSSNKKRSPPYTSPLYDNHSRSPTIATHVSNDYGRRSPRATPPEANYKIRFAADHATAAQSPSSGHLQQQHAPHQSYFSPYTMSPKYVPAPLTSMSPNSPINSNAARSPRHSSNINAHIPTSNTSSANSIPTRELSPPRSATAPPRETTPRTVPKKTASIRRQFASPTSSAMPSDRADEQQQDRKTHHNTKSAVTAHQQHSYQHASNNSHVASLTAAGASPLHYYMYAQNAAGPSSTNAGSGASVAAAAAAAVAAYIPTVIPPSYYHPYISTLAALRHNPMWLHYPGASPAGMPPQNQAASRLSSPFHNFPYNGVGAAAVAAAAAAASAFGGPMTPSSHMSQVGLAHQMSAPSAIHHPAYGRASIHSPKLTDEKSIHTTKQTTATSIYPSSIKDEHSSDVPLNLSKH